MSSNNSYLELFWVRIGNVRVYLLELEMEAVQEEDMSGAKVRLLLGFGGESSKRSL